MTSQALKKWEGAILALQSAARAPAQQAELYLARVAEQLGDDDDMSLPEVKKLIQKKVCCSLLGFKMCVATP